MPSKDTFMTNRHILPEVGDIWYNHLGKYFYLILDDNYKMSMSTENGFTMLILDTGRYDHAYLDHFFAQCHFIS